eukprot:756188-Hanusia_phi.AAC.1
MLVDHNYICSLCSSADSLPLPPFLPLPHSLSLSLPPSLPPSLSLPRPRTLSRSCHILSWTPTPDPS